MGSRPDMPSLPPPSSGPGAREGHRAAVVLRVHCPKRGETPAGSREPRACNRQDRRRAAGVRVPPRSASGSSPLWVVRAGPPGGRGRGDGRGGRSVQAGPARACYPSTGRVRSPVARRACAAVGRRARWRVRWPRVLGLVAAAGAVPPHPTPWRTGPTGVPRGVVSVSTAAVTVALTDPPARCNCAATPQPRRKDRELPAARVVFTRLLPRGTTAVELLEESAASAACTRSPDSVIHRA